MVDFRHARNASCFARLDEDPLPRSARPEENLAEDLLDAGEALLAAVEEGVISAEAAERIFEHLHLVLGGMAGEAPAAKRALTPQEELAIAMA